MKWQDFDLDGRLKNPIGFSLVLLYLMRAYLTWIVSLTYSEDRGLLLGYIYPNKDLFYFTLMVGIPALLCFFLFSLRKWAHTKVYQKLWRWQWLLLLAALLVDVFQQGISLSAHITSTKWWQMLTLLLGIYLTWYWGRSQRIKRFFTLYVEHHSEKTEKQDSNKS